MNTHFIEAYPSFGKVSDRMKDMWYTELGAKYQEPTVNAVRLHIETGSLIPTDEQLMFKATGESNKSNVYGFGLQSAVITAEHWGGNSSSMSSTAGQEAYIKRERRLWGYMQ
ncbi:hypothetical protein M9H77_21294 [Catharanthus roseus]|uniref:Uncharacterized protein n=1 Tax=Catharanthus roseus TaxID=4058 RepID=A0ACC0AMY6_CATRO|nr:hypothetical protein M9H77_21294 [Catharanthus roseus]